MPVEIITTKYGYYIPMDGPWQSEEDNAAYKAAFNLFEEMRVNNNYVALIQSHHEYSHGYWLETRKTDVKFPDHILIQNFK
jgi:hypothetical protein